MINVVAAGLAGAFAFAASILASQGASAAGGVPTTAPALAAPLDANRGVRAVTFVNNDIASAYITSAKTVGEFLAERKIVPGEADFVSSPTDAPIDADMSIVYRSAIPVTIVTGSGTQTVLSSARTVAELLSNQKIVLDANDDVDPGLYTHPEPGGIVRVRHGVAWTATLHENIGIRTEDRYDASLEPGTTRLADPGRSGERTITTRFVQYDGAKPTPNAIAYQIVRAPRPRVVLHGIGEYDAFANRLTDRAISETGRITGYALRMVATAYTANCYGCSGITATGLRAGHGVVAVDPRVIPLGSKLYIPGYGNAIAGDTGGAIKSRRIDLGFKSLHDALRFGRREITVYVLR